MNDGINAEKAEQNRSMLTLGTAQLGFDYGIANDRGKLDHSEAFKVLQTALDSGITSFDTSYLYGESEKIIGSFLNEHNVCKKDLTITSKIPKIKLKEGCSLDEVYNEVKRYAGESMERLGLSKIPVYMMHDAADIDSYGGKVLESLKMLQDEGIIGMIGVSVYYPEEALKALERDSIRAIQLPANLFDHRFIKNDLISKLNRAGKIIFVRSVFLQGLFFLGEKCLSGNMNIAAPYLSKLIRFSQEEGIGIDELAMGFAKGIEGVASVIMGAESSEQVLRNRGLEKAPDIDGDIIEKIMDIFSGIPDEIILPQFWGTSK